jgi:hypothetical protein
MKAKITHTIIRNSNLFCLHCGREQILNYPIEIPMLGAMIGAFNKIHRFCKPTDEKQIFEPIKKLEDVD